MPESNFYIYSDHPFFNLKIDVKKIYEEYPITNKVNPQPNLVPFAQSLFHKLIYRNQEIPQNYRELLWRYARQINLDLSWFQEFQNYWSSVLHGRSLLSVQDFFFLKNFYRIKFAECEVPDTQDPYIFLEAWQSPELIYTLLHFVFKETVVNKLQLLNHLFQLRHKNVDCYLEFGCGTAPITTSLFEFYQAQKDIKIYITDIETLTFHYAAYKFRQCSNVIPILLVPENHFLLNLTENVDLIFCMEVFEHLNKPLETIQIFHQTLTSKGLLFFDYSKTEGLSMDSQHSARERNDVLDFISKNFDVLYGSITKDRNMSLTIVRKK